MYAIGLPATRVCQAENTISQLQEDVAMIGTSVFSAPTEVALCYLQFISSPLPLQIAKWCAQPPTTQDEFHSFSLTFKIV